MAYLYKIYTKTGQETILECETQYSKAQINALVATFVTDLEAQAARGNSLSKANSYSQFIASLRSQGFKNVTYQAAIQLSGDNMDFLVE